MKLRYLTVACLLMAVSIASGRDLENRDVYREVTPVAANPHSQFANLDGRISSMDQQRGVPTFIWAQPGKTPMTQRLAPVPAAEWYLGRFAKAYRLSKAALATAYVHEVHDIGRGGIIVSFRQRVNGVDVIRNRMSVLMTRDLQLVAITGNLHEAAVPASLPFALDARAATARALSDVSGATIWNAGVVDTGRNRHGYGYYDVRADSGLAAAGLQLSEPARAKPVLYPLPDRLVPAYHVEMFTGPLGGTDSRAHGYAISADTGEVLMRHNLTVSDVFHYNAYADPTGDLRPREDPMGEYTPHPSGTPNNYDPGLRPPEMISIEGFNSNPMGMADPWLPAGATESTGNNVDAYADVTAPDGYNSGDVRATTTSPNTFDHTYDTSLPPNANTQQREAAATSLFYTTNWLHDYFYDSGFDEAAGNAQEDNFGRGGIGGDRMRAEAQDSSGTNNANMSTPGDGASPRMQMYVWSGPPGDPQRDGTLDNSIVAHEWGHYIHHRLASCGSNQCASQSEGWGDFLALHTMIREGDDYHGSFGVGGYGPVTFGDSVYYGIRRVPYSTNPSNNALSFRHIEDGQPLPTSHPVNGIWAGNPNSGVHNSGEIWASMLHDSYVAFLDQSTGANPTRTFAEARRLMADYIVAGLKLVPVDATYTEQRSAIIAAAAANSPADALLLAQTFAGRGAGSCAQSPDRYSTNHAGVVEDFDVRGAIEIVSTGVDDSIVTCDGDGYLDAGEIGLITVTVANVGDAELLNTSVTLTDTSNTVAFPNGDTVMIPTIMPYKTATVTLQIEVLGSVINTDTALIDVTASNMDACDSQVVDLASHPVHFDLVGTTIDRVESPVSTWTISSGGDGIWSRAEYATGNHAWYGIDLGSPSDSHLLSAPMQVSATQDFVVRFRHRYDFEEDATTWWDGGLIEVTRDGGVTWEDVDNYTNPGYDGVITDLAGNPLANRDAYSGPSPAWPDFNQVGLLFGTAFAGETVQLRFRIGTDAAVGDFGWQIDNILLQGVDNLPFIGVSDNVLSCNGVPTADAGPDQTVDAGDTVTLDASASSDPDGDPLSFLWNQTAGEAVTLADDTMAMTTFVAPSLPMDTVLTFAIAVDDGTATVEDSVDITVRAELGGNPDAAVPDAAVPDAGVPDAGTPDAAVDPDAAIPDPDAAVSPDAGTTDPPDPDGGCCRATPLASGDLALGGLVLLGLLAITRRREREPVS